MIYGDLITYFLTLILSFLGAALLVPLIMKLAIRLKVVDNPVASSRKIHKLPIPLLGGTAIFIVSSLGILIFNYFSLANFSLISDGHLLWVLLGGLILILGGYLDDKYNLKPYHQIFFPILATLIIIFSGIKISYVSNFITGNNSDILFLAPAIGTVLTFIWLMAMMYTTKLLDGLDGLLTGIASIASLSIFIISLVWDVPMSATSIWALLILGSCLGFLIYNWNPAKIFLGEGGSLFLGYILGVLSIISGSKIATTILVMGIPMLDVGWVIIKRMSKKQSPFSHSDQKHLHYQLLEIGFNQKQAVIFLYLISLVFGLLAILNGSWGKILGLVVLFIFMVSLLSYIYIKERKSHEKV